MHPSRVLARPHRLAVYFSSLLLFCGAALCRAQGAPAAQRPDQPVPIDATSAVLIVDTPTQTGDVEALLQRRINTHVATLRSEQTLRKAVSRAQSPIRNTHWFKDSDSPAERLAFLKEKLHVAAIPGTSLIQVSLDAVKDPAERATIVEEICNAYLDSRRRVSGDEALDRTQMLNNVKIKAEMRMKDLTSELREKQVKLNLDGGGIGRVGIKEMELSKLVGELVDAQLKAGKAKATYDATQAAVQQGQDPALTEVYVEKIAPFLANDRRQLQQMEGERDALAEQKGAGDPAYKIIASRCDRMRANYQQKYDAARAKAKLIILEELNTDYQAENGKLEGLTKRVDNLKQDLAELANATVAYYNLQEEQKGLREQIRTIKQRIETVMAEQSSRENIDIHWHLTPDAVP
jgi:hypothetical protein